MKRRLADLVAEKNKSKRSLTKQNKVYPNSSLRDTPCMCCANSAASGKSPGTCKNQGTEGAERCVRYDQGGNVCSPIPEVLLPFALHMCALRKACWKRENTAALNAAIHAWKVACELYVSGSFDGLYVREREEQDPKSPEIPRSIRRAMESRALKARAALRTPTKRGRGTGKGRTGGSGGDGSGGQGDDEDLDDDLSSEMTESDESGGDDNPGDVESDISEEP